MGQPISVKVAVREVLLKEAPNHVQDWDQMAPDTTGNLKEQLGTINHFLRLQLGLSDANSVEARECLDDSMRWSHWFSYFNRYSLPIIRQCGFKRLF